MTARILSLLLIIGAALGLAGCFTSDHQLITDDQATAPYARITFAEQDSPDDRTTLTRQGKTYVARVDDSTITMRFRSFGDDLYLAESTSEEDGKVQRLYAVLKLDPAQNLALAYKATAHDSDVGPGLPACKRDDMDMVCIEDVDAYVALARAAIAAGAPPETTYTVSFK